MPAFTGAAPRVPSLVALSDLYVDSSSISDPEALSAFRERQLPRSEGPLHQDQPAAQVRLMHSSQCPDISPGLKYWALLGLRVLLAFQFRWLLEWFLLQAVLLWVHICIVFVTRWLSEVLYICMVGTTCGLPEVLQLYGLYYKQASRDSAFVCFHVKRVSRGLIFVRCLLQAGFSRAYLYGLQAFPVVSP